MRNEQTNLTNSFWSPLESFWDLHNEMDRVMDVWKTPNTTKESTSLFTPSADVWENDSSFMMALDIPGVPKEDIKIEIEDSKLVISGERKREEVGKDTQWRSATRIHGKFKTAFSLPPTVNFEKIEADFNDGVLKILLPKKEAAKPRQIKVGDGKSGVFAKLLESKKETE